MASKKKSGKSKSNSKSAKISSKAQASIKKPKSSESHPKTNTTKRGKPKTSKKSGTKARSSASPPKKSKAPPSPRKTKPSVSTLQKKARPPAVSSGRSKALADAGLSTQDCYNLGGLCACVIDTTAKDGKSRLQRLLQNLNLPGIDQANLMRVSQGIRFPKLFADGLADEGIRRKAFERLKRFAKADGPASKQWKDDLQELERLLGM